jgi:hypothetical protein
MGLLLQKTYGVKHKYALGENAPHIKIYLFKRKNCEKIR